MKDNYQKTLEERIAKLEKENRYLKTLLYKAGIAYKENGQELNSDSESYQNAPSLCEVSYSMSIQQRKITTEDATVFFSMFWGRTDVYAKRSVNKSTGKAYYYPQCANFWKSGCPRRYGRKIKCSECEKRAYVKLGRIQIMAHLNGTAADCSDVIGIYPLFPDGTCRLLVFDFDNHDADEKADARASDEWKEEVNALRRICEENGVDALVERSRSGNGAHVWIFFKKPVAATLARKFGKALLYRGAQTVSLPSFRYFDRMFPANDCISNDGLGNLIALPLQGQALKEGNSAFVDENWNAYPDQWKILLSKKKYDKEFLEEKIKTWEHDYTLKQDSLLLREEDVFSEDGEKPWSQTSVFMREDVDGRLKIVLSDGIYIDKSNLKPRIQNRIRELAAFSNPVFYRNRAMGLSNYKNDSVVYMGKDTKGYLRIPRGLLQNQWKGMKTEY